MIWHNPATNPPRPLVDVLLAIVGEAQASEGYRVERVGTGGILVSGWLLSTGHPVDPENVYAWTDLPACPKIGGAS